MLYQATWYARLPLGRRAQFHQHFGEWLERTAGGHARERAVELAVHFEEGQDYGRAVQYRRQAGETALHRSATQEAVVHFTKGLALLETFPDTPERTQQELMLHALLGASLVMSKGYAAREVEYTYARARELCQRLGESPQLFPVLLGLWGFHLTRGEFQLAQELGQHLLSLVHDAHDPALLLGASRAIGITRYYLGELMAAHFHLEQSLTLYDPQQHRPRAFLYSVADPGVACLSYDALALWLLGYPTQALAQMHKALALARELAHPFSQAFALTFAAIVHQLRRDSHVVHEQVDALLALASEQGFGQFMIAGTILRGSTIAEQGQRNEGIVQMRDSLATAQALGAEIGRPYYLSLLAEAYAEEEATDAGVRVLDEALTGAHVSSEYTAELYRLKGEFTLQQSRGRRRAVGLLNEAEEYFEKAIAIAQQQQAKLLELRAVMSLSRLWQRQGKRQEAHRLLSDIYHWFTEGFDTKDLQEAKALLGALS